MMVDDDEGDDDGHESTSSDVSLSEVSELFIMIIVITFITIHHHPPHHLWRSTGDGQLIRLATDPRHPGEDIIEEPTKQRRRTLPLPGLGGSQNRRSPLSTPRQRCCVPCLSYIYSFYPSRSSSSR